MLAAVVALYAAFAGGAGSDARAPLQAELNVRQQAPVDRAAGLDTTLAEEERTGSASSLQMLPSLTELRGVAAPQVTTTAESRVATLNQAIRTTPTPASSLSTRECDPSSVAAYCVYTVQEGDTLSSIAAYFDLTSEHMPGWELLVASNKPDIVSADDYLQPGQKLRIPSSSGVVHTVILDETVGDLAGLFDTTSAAIIRVNGLTDANLIGNGQVLLIPDPKRIPSPNEPAPSAGPEPTATEEPTSAPGRSQEPTPEPTPEPAKGFIWPITVSVRITNYFSARHPLGIDLGLGHAPGSPVVAVAPGKVTFAGGDPCCSYGYYVIVDHENGLKTLYAHLRSINVSVGQRVSQGQTLGPSGTTGYSTGVHLHFEVHKNGTRVDPLPYLP